ncbi:DMT family transporter [Kineococcus sp. SYSU DK018]|uniref:DMT family transporter n=1 Tax=Kineococcus sp. SYSU DK018 TaxID=3383139 RepID=UPI003D7E628F
MIAIVLATVLWGTTGTAATLLPGTVSPLATGAATTAIGGLLLAASAPRATWAVLRTGPAWRWLAAGTVCVAVYPLAFYTAMSLAGVAVGNVVSLGTAPVFAALLERFVDPPASRNRLQPRWLVAAGTAVLGVAILALLGQEGSAAPSSGETTAGGRLDDHGSTLVGVGLGALAGLAYAGYTCTASRLLRLGPVSTPCPASPAEPAAGSPDPSSPLSSRGVVAAQFGAGALLLLPVLLLTGAPLLHSPAATGPEVAAGAQTPLTALVGAPSPPAVIAYLALGPMFCAYLLFGRGLRTVAASRATTLTLLEPFAATVLAVAVVGERLTPAGWTGLALVLLGVVAVATEHRTTTPGTPTAPAASVVPEARGNPHPRADHPGHPGHPDHPPARVPGR